MRNRDFLCATIRWSKELASFLTAVLYDFKDIATVSAGNKGYWHFFVSTGFSGPFTISSKMVAMAGILYLVFVIYLENTWTHLAFNFLWIAGLYISGGREGQ
jgi:hypothetical protein